jgi:hypothetical protein
MTIAKHLYFLQFWLVALLVLGGAGVALAWPTMPILAVAAWASGCLIGWGMAHWQAKQATLLQHSLHAQNTPHDAKQGLKQALPIVLGMLVRLTLAPLVLVAWLVADVSLVGVALAGCLSLNSGVVVGWLWHRVVS